MDDAILALSFNYSRSINDHVANHWRGSYYEDRFNFSGQDESNQVLALRDGETEEDWNDMRVHTCPRGAEDRILVRGFFVQGYP